MLLLFISCHKTEKEPGTNIIDRSYLKSGSFKAFQDQTHAETKRSIRQEHQFSRFVQRVLSREHIKAEQAPVTINQERIRKVLKSDQIGQPLMVTAFGGKQLYHSLAKIKANNRYYHFFIMCKIASYDNCLIWLATTQKNSINSLQMIALYNRAPVFHEAPSIQVIPPQVHVKINRLVKYPLKMENSYNLNYQISSNGDIYRIIK